MSHTTHVSGVSHGLWPPALTSVNGRGACKPDLGVSRVAAHPAASRAQIRAQFWLLTRSIAALTIASVRVSAFRPEWLICGYELGMHPLGVPQRPSRCPHLPRLPYRSRAAVGVLPRAIGLFGSQTPRRAPAGTSTPTAWSSWPKLAERGRSGQTPKSRG